MEYFTYKGVYYEYCDAVVKNHKCLSTATFYFTAWHRQFSFSELDSLIMEVYDRKAWDSFLSILHTFFTIATIVCWFALARIVTQLVNRFSPKRSLWQLFLIEFMIIAIPCILSVNFFNQWVEVFVLAMAMVLGFAVCSTNCLKSASLRTFDLGARPHIYTLLRSTVYIWTVLCILAIDFNNFPKEFRKSRSYGAALMDVGIGLFITVMAMVSKRLTTLRAWKNTIIATVALLTLGALRTIVVMYLNYGQDEHEYGRHFNAFFILAFTKFFGSLVSALARNDIQLLPLSVGVIAFHELVLQCGLQQYVINPFAKRDTFFGANREGLSSITGFVGLYLLCLFIFKNLNLKGSLNYLQLCRIIKVLFGLVLNFIFLTIISIFTIGISRVTCNFGYIVWMLTVTLIMTLIYLILFDVILNTLMPISVTPTSFTGDTIEQALFKSDDAKMDNILPIPILADAVNMNGLIYFMIGNFLTGFVNIFLNPSSRNDEETLLILSVYFLLTTGFVFILYSFKIRIA